MNCNTGEVTRDMELAAAWLSQGDPVVILPEVMKSDIPVLTEEMQEEELREQFSRAVENGRAANNSALRRLAGR